MLRMGMLGRTTLHHFTWCRTRALMTVGSQKTDLVDNLWKIKSRHKKPVHVDVISMEGSEGPQELRSHRIPVRPHHLDFDRLTSTETGSNPADIIPSVTPFKCNVCGRVYKNRKYLNMHFKKSSNCLARTASLPGWLPPEPEPPPKITKLPKPKKLKLTPAPAPYVCVTCNKPFKTSNELWKHRRRSEKCKMSRGEQGEEDQLTMDMIKALAAEGPYVFPELREKKPAMVKESNLRWKRELQSMVATIGGAHVVVECLGDARINSYVVESSTSETSPMQAVVEKSKEEEDAEERELKELIEAIRSNEELNRVLETTRKKFACQWCAKEFKTKKGIINHESKGCKKKPLTPEEAAALKLAEEQARNDKIKAELIVTRRPLLAAWFDIMVNKGRVKEAFEDFQLLRSNEKWKEVVESTKVYDILLRCVS